MSEEEKMLREAVVVFLRRGYGFEEKQGESVPVTRQEVNLARKTRKIGKGLWNGYGGGVEPGQTAKEAAIEELREESSVVASAENLRQIALVHILNTNSSGESVPCELYVYELWLWGGTPRPTQDQGMITPTWFPIDKLPLSEMLLADQHYLPRALRGELLEVTAHYGPYQKELLAPLSVERVRVLR